MNNKDFIPALTGIRAVCVYFIFFKHLNLFSQEQYPVLYFLFNQFYTFLSFFFVLSGFLIYYKYHEIGNLQNKKKLYNYFISRIARVFPVLVILTTITFILGYLEKLYSGLNAITLYILNITLVKGFSSSFFLTGIGPSWSMSVEELFYLSSPLIFLYAKKTSSLIKIVITSYILGLMLTYLFTLYPFYGFFSSFHFTAGFTFFGRVFEFACGIYLGMIVTKSRPLMILPKNALYIGIGIVLLSLTLLFLIAWQDNIQHANDLWTGIFVNNIIMPVGITFIFYSLIYHKSLLQKILASRLMVQLGYSTYSFYLLHTTFVLSYIYKYLSSNFIITFISMIIISFIFYKTVEQPLAVLIRKRFSLRT